MSKYVKKPKLQVGRMQAEINIVEAPYHADPTGIRDCTNAIIQALNDITRATLEAFRQTLDAVAALPDDGVRYHPDGFENQKDDGVVKCSFCARLPYLPRLYFPAGLYLVSDTLCYAHTDLVNTYGVDLNQQIRIRGAGMNKSMIRLRDHAVGFAAGSRKPVLSYMPGASTNVAMSNYCEDLTINCGRGNAGAVGLDFFANNSGAVRHVKVVSEDGEGFAGIQLGHGNYSGVLIKHVVVDGFDHGLHIDSSTGTMFAHAEDVHVRGQRIAGITVGAVSLSLRNIRTLGVPVAVSCVAPVGFTVLVDSVLAGKGGAAIDRRAGGLYVSNVRVNGFDECCVGEPSRCERGYIDEWVYPGISGPSASGLRMERLPIEETPVWVGNGAVAGVRSFGAKGDGISDDTAAIQRVFDSGARDVRFEPGRYLLDAPVTIPSGVAHIDFSFCDLVAGSSLKHADAEGFRIVGDSRETPLFIERLFAWEQWSGRHCTFTHAGTRTVCFKDMHTQTLRFYQNTVRGGRVFFDNVATTSGVIPGTNGHGRCPILLQGQEVWARQLNPERGEPMILNDGGTLVLMGYKSEGMGVVVHTIHGGRTEILGGVINIGRTGDVAFVTEDSQARISTASQGWHPGAYHRFAVRTITEGKCEGFPSAGFPSRGFDASRGPQYIIPLS